MVKRSPGVEGLGGLAVDAQAPAVAGAPEDRVGVGQGARREARVGPQGQGAGAREDLRRQRVTLDAHDLLGQLHGEHGQLGLWGEAQALAGEELGLRRRLAVHQKTPPQGEQAQAAAAQAHQRVGLGDVGVVQAQGGGPDPADDVAGGEVVYGAVREAKADGRAH
jgi:hypothetical protein